MPRREVEPRLRGFAKSMRKAMTEAELHLWMHLRRQRLRGFKFRRQVPIGPFIVDFFCAELRLIVEIDGGQHFDDEAVAADARRTAWLQAQGYQVLRFTNRDVVQNMDGVWAVLAELARQRRPKPSP
ncbi:endonuclease domain-containing protein [Kaistia dalseonensis]|uniref:Very-short-patch-repair endonuclease n=1 Tax=Kaistia dalseonensis TaxID=410840 RepID=A0ABU0HB54_9HYPH|nr:endonuclease domain-containing protein [Kaistia dalseonensis]MCX5496109.1 endonuclease domain-containing protein [Kaistia dalseonensis]MDQ0438716.1 very-short-patch-repair endonuclease [Kaistia dalseonensis]